MTIHPVTRVSLKQMIDLVFYRSNSRLPAFRRSENFLLKLLQGRLGKRPKLLLLPRASKRSFRTATRFSFYISSSFSLHLSLISNCFLRNERQKKIISNRFARISDENDLLTRLKSCSY